MLQIVIEGTELFDEATETFSTVDDITLELEHSLLSLSKWESKFQKPFLGPGDKTTEETLGYILSMVISPEHLPDDLTARLSRQNFIDINEYIDSKQSGTTFSNLPGNRGPSEIITSELVYYWLVALNIPFHPTETWHLNRLFALVRICNIKNSDDQKMPTQEVSRQYKDLNAQRRAQLGTSG